jgi:kinetochore protein Spc24
LEQEHYSTGKQLNEEQSAVAKKEVDLGRWKADREEVGKVVVGNDDWADGGA